MALRHLLAALLLAALPCSATAQASTWIVDDDGPADFASLQVAFNTVAPGSTLILRPGSYGTTILMGKGVRILADGPGARSLRVRLSNLRATQRFVYIGDGRESPDEPVRFRFEDCAGTIWLESMPVRIENTVRNCDQLVLHDVRTTGGGLRIEGTELVAQDSILTGRDGSDGLVYIDGGLDCVLGTWTLVPGQPGEPGLNVRAGAAVLVDCLLQAGDGGRGTTDCGEACSLTYFCTRGGNGGDAVRVEAGAKAYVFDCVLKAGELGEGGANCDTGERCEPGLPGRLIGGDGIAEVHSRPGRRPLSGPRPR